MSRSAFKKDPDRDRKSEFFSDHESEGLATQPIMNIEGKVTYQDLEGGFWGIIDSEGNKYVPIDRLPDEVRKDGTHVKAELETVHMLGTTMWGSHVKVVSISPTG